MIFQEALKFYTSETAPLRYATLQINLGEAYRVIGVTEKRADILQSAIAAFRQAMLFVTSETAPIIYAAAQNNIGLAYNSLAQLEDRVNNLQLAIEAYQEALRFRTPGNDPHGYARTQRSLGFAFDDLGDLRAAIACWHEAVIYFWLVGYIDEAAQTRSWIEEGEAKLGGDSAS